jgi:RHS repeat-associated protein
MQISFIYDCTPRFVHSRAFEPSRYTGKERDTESGLDYFGARYYASSMARWMSPDLVNVTEDRMVNPSSTLNKYAYGANNPLKYTDPDVQDITVFYESGAPGHIMMMAYDPSLNSAATRSFGPDLDFATGSAGSLSTMFGFPVPATTTFDFDKLTSADAIRQSYASMTIRTSPEVTQQVVQAMVAHSGDKWYTTGGYACASSCAKILRQINQFRKQCCTGALIPNTFFTDLYEKYGNSKAPRNALGSPIFHSGTSYGSYHPSWNEFDMLNSLINPTQQKPTRNCTINVNSDGTESGDC